MGQVLGVLAELLGKLLGMGGEVLEEDLLLPEVAWHAAGVIEQARFASQAQAVESGEDEENEGAEVR